MYSSVAADTPAPLRHVGLRVPGGRGRAHHDGVAVADKVEDEDEVARRDDDNEGGLGRQGRPRDAAEDVVGGQRRGPDLRLNVSIT